MKAKQIAPHIALILAIGMTHQAHAQLLGGRMGGMFLDPISLSRCEWVAEPAEAPEGEAVES